MRTTLLPKVSLLCLLVLVAAGCGAPDGTGADARVADGEDSGGQEEGDASVADATRTDADLVIWADDDRAAALRPFADAFADDHAVTVAVQSVPFEQIRDQVQVAGPDGEGPDVFVGDHDWLGELVPAGMVTTIDLGDRAAEFADVALSAVTDDGRTYGVPYALSSVALLRNTRHVPSAPATWEELTDTARTLQRRGSVPVGVVLPDDPYHLYPLVSGFGGYLFGRDADGDYDPSDLGIDSPGAQEAAARSREWSAEGVVDLAGSGAEAAEQFGAGDAAFALLDPGTVDPDVEGAAAPEVPYAISAVPAVEGGTARPLVSVEALMVSGFAVDSELARRFAVDYAATGDAQDALASAAGRPPAHLAVADAVSDADLAGWGASARDGVALPAAPQTGSVWGPWADALERVRADGADPREALTEAADEVRALIGG